MKSVKHTNKIMRLKPGKRRTALGGDHLVQHAAITMLRGKRTPKHLQTQGGGGCYDTARVKVGGFVDKVEWRLRLT